MLPTAQRAAMREIVLQCVRLCRRPNGPQCVRLSSASKGARPAAPPPLPPSTVQEHANVAIVVREASQRRRAFCHACTADVPPMRKCGGSAGSSTFFGARSFGVQPCAAHCLAQRSSLWPATIALAGRRRRPNGPQRAAYEDLVADPIKRG